MENVNVNENIPSTEYVLYQNKIYSVHHPDTNNEDNKVWCSQLHTSGFWFYREVIRGRSGICDFGAYCGPVPLEEYRLILKNGEPWSHDKVRSRLRYSNRDGGKMFDSFRDSRDEFFNKISSKISNFFNIK